VAPHPAEAHPVFPIEPRQLVLQPRPGALCAGTQYIKAEPPWIEVLPSSMFVGPLVMFATERDVRARDGGEGLGLAAVSEKER
jgi:hypothetical protein